MRARTPTILEAIDWEKINETVSIEQSNREIHVPYVSSFRWWARRPHTLIGAILDVAQKTLGDDITVADPFSGGGTVALEAIRRNINVYSQDLYPWPTQSLAWTLTPTSLQELADAIIELRSQLDQYRAWYIQDNGLCEITHILSIRFGLCKHCGNHIFIFREPLVSLVSRRRDEQEAYYGCPQCGSVQRSSKNATRFLCRSCNKYWPTDSTSARWPITSAKTIECPSCGRSNSFPELIQEEPLWKPVLIQEVELDTGKKRQLRALEPGELIEDRPPSAIERTLKVKIPPGIETNRLRKAGFTYWGDLYTHRQAQILLYALKKITVLNSKQAVKDRLALAVLGAAEMPAYLCRWDRYHLKAFEATANHRYAQTTMVVEQNPLAPIGRGTIPKRLAAAQKTLAWLMQETETFPKVSLRDAEVQPRKIGKVDGIVIVTGDSARQLLGSGKADLVLTDPPYYDNVQYGELSRLFHVWLSLYSSIPEIDEQLEAVPNRVRGIDGEEYEGRIAECLKESRRTLKSDGRIILTFHNNNIRAWRALAGALMSCGLCIAALSVVRAENAADHSKRNRKVFLHDLLIECVPRERHSGGAPAIAGVVETSEARNLLAIGLAMSKSLTECDVSILDALYIEYLTTLGDEDRRIR